MDLEELRLVYEAGMRAFPPRKADQPIFYPVLNLQYANEIAKGWNVQGHTASGFSAKFTLDDTYSARFDPHKVGAAHHVELWIPAEEMTHFNKHIFPPISIVSAYFGKKFQGHVPSQFGLSGSNAAAQFVALARTLDYSLMDFRCEILANHTTIFLNYAFWLQAAFPDQGINEPEQRRVLSAIQRIWSDCFPKIDLPLTNGHA